MRRRIRARDEALTRSIERYRLDVLAPRGLDSESWELQTHKRSRRVYLGSTRVWKIYRPKQESFARNFALAARFLGEHGLRVPRLLHVDLDSSTAEQYQLCCLVMERISGAPMSFPLTPEQLRTLGVLLARLHSFQFSRGLAPEALPVRGERSSWFGRDLESDLTDLERWIPDKLVPVRDRIADFAREGAPKWISQRGLSIISGDPHPTNFFLEPGGGTCMIDLDLTRLGAFQTDLAMLLLAGFGKRIEGPSLSAERAVAVIEEASAPFLEAYFGTAPSDFRAGWEATRRSYFIRVGIHRAWNRLKQIQPEYNSFHRRDPEVQRSKAALNLRLVETFLNGG